MQAFNLLINLQHVSAHQETILNGGGICKRYKIGIQYLKAKVFCVAQNQNCFVEFFVLSVMETFKVFFLALEKYCLKFLINERERERERENEIIILLEFFIRPEKCFL